MFTSGAFDQMLFQEKKAKKSVWYHLFLKRALDRSAAIHLATPYERQQSHRFVSQWNNFVVPHCINAEQFQPIANAKQSIKQRYGIPESAALLMAAGRIDAKKRLDILFEAMALSKDREEFHLLVVGQDVGELAEQLKSNCRRLNLDNKVTWTGLISTDQMAAYYSAADLLVHLSVDENFGMVVAEAMACGTPVLVTPGVGVWHTVSDASVGRCVDLTTKAVADGLTHFHDNRSTWRSWGENANQVAHARFSPPSVASAMITAFSDVIQSQQSVDCDWFIPQ
jgi:glycosyltransferase involved in cell wall biosynthesis